MNGSRGKSLPVQIRFQVDRKFYHPSVANVDPVFGDSKFAVVYLGFSSIPADCRDQDTVRLFADLLTLLPRVLSVLLWVLFTYFLVDALSQNKLLILSVLAALDLSFTLHERRKAGVRHSACWPLLLCPLRLAFLLFRSREPVACSRNHFRRLLA